MDDSDLTRQALRDLLGREAGMVVVGEAADGHAAVQRARDFDPDVVLMDVMMPKMNGIQATRRLTAEQPRVRVLAVTMLVNRRLVEAMLEAGAAGYLLKDDAAEELVSAVRAVAAGRRFLSRALGGGPNGALPQS